MGGSQDQQNIAQLTQMMQNAQKKPEEVSFVLDASGLCTHTDGAKTDVTGTLLIYDVYHRRRKGNRTPGYNTFRGLKEGRSNPVFLTSLIVTDNRAKDVYNAIINNLRHLNEVVTDLDERVPRD